MCLPITPVDQKAYQFGEVFFAQMFLLAGDDYLVPADRRLDAAIKRVVENGKASTEIKDRLHFPVGSTGMFCLELEDMVRGARMQGVGILEELWNSGEYRFRKGSEWPARRMLRDGPIPEGLTEFAQEVLDQLSSPEIQEYK